MSARVSPALPPQPRSRKRVGRAPPATRPSSRSTHHPITGRILRGAGDTTRTAPALHLAR
ncbi:conserved hypothetical protein [Citreicella sp. SE45]|nr:conserved hypothetical protein [Citreicella sp. SE45]